MNDILISVNLPTLLLLVITLLAIGACFFLAGYLIGYKQNAGVFSNVSRNYDNKKQKHSELITKIDIDDKKIVTKINTDNLEKKYHSLGDTKVAIDDISGSVNKLKNIKR